MALKWTNPQDLDRYFRQLQEEYDRKAIIWLESLGERVVKYAREHGSYADRTGNLRNSIGYIVIQSGKVVKDGCGNSAPQRKTREHLLDVAKERKGYKTYPVWGTGIEYARCVEAKGFDVIEGSGDWVESNAETLKAEFARFLKNNKL